MANKVLLILVDGMRPDSIPLCGDPSFEEFFKSGTVCSNIHHDRGCFMV